MGKPMNSDQLTTADYYYNWYLNTTHMLMVITPVECGQDYRSEESETIILKIKDFM